MNILVDQFTAHVRRITVGMIVALAACAPADAPSSAPDTFTVAFETSEGPFEVEFVRAWSPIGVDRVWTLAQTGYWSGSRIYRVNDRYAQFGYSGQPELDAEWVQNGIPDEPARASNLRGAVSFARGGPGTRSSILFVNLGDNSNLDAMAWNSVVGFPPVGRVVSGMESVDGLYSGYGDTPMQWEDSIASKGNVFLDREYPLLDSITSVSVR
ncbi:MAG: peptidylprolyl isomerase [Longimicrobiales bacterium]|nr:peptidylprolyl isomerase [Longimicrobiales bacterium]